MSMKLSKPKGTPFAKADAAVKNGTKLIWKIRNHTTKNKVSSSLLKFLRYSEQIKFSTFYYKSDDYCYLSVSKTRVQFRKWSS